MDPTTPVTRTTPRPAALWRRPTAAALDRAAASAALLGAVLLGLVGAPDAARAQYYPPYYQPQPYYGPPPCNAVTPSPLSGAARGAAGGAIFGAIAGNAGAGAAIGAGIGGIANMARQSSARNSGACY